MATVKDAQASLGTCQVVAANCRLEQWKARPRSCKSGALQERADAGTSTNPGRFQTSSWADAVQGAGDSLTEIRDRR